MDDLRVPLLSICVALAASCGKSESTKAEPAPVAESAARQEGSTAEPEAKTEKASTTTAAPEAAVAKDAAVASTPAAKVAELEGPFPSLAAYCEKSVEANGEHAQCDEQAPKEVDGPLVVKAPAAPFSGAQIFTQGYDDYTACYESECSLGVRVESGWFVLPAVFDCSTMGGTPGVVERLEISADPADSLGRRVLLLVYRERRNDSQKGVSTEGTQKRLVVCGVGAPKRVACLDDLLLSSDVVRKSSAGTVRESYELGFALSSGNLEVFKVRGDLPADVKLGSYPLRFAAGTGSTALVPAADELEAYRTHMRAGRKMVRAKRYEDAVKELEIAVKAGFGHRAHSELGYAAYKAGDLDKAVEASAEGARANDPRIAAASLYNLGLAHEAAGRKEKAVQAYERSLSLRPSKAVHDRLEKLRGDVYGWAAKPPCSESAMTEAALKSCLGDGTDDGDSAYPRLTGVTIERKGKMAAVHVHTSDGHGFGEERYLLARVLGDRLWLLSEAVAGDVRPSAESGFEIAKVERQKLGKRRLIRVEAVHTLNSGVDDPNANFIEESTSRLVFFCEDDEAKPRCTRAIPAGGRWRARLGARATEPRHRELFTEIFDAEAPTGWSYELGAELDEKGIVHLKSGNGIRPYVAELALFAPE